MWTELEPEKYELTKEFAKMHALRPHLKGDRDWESTSGKVRCEWLDTKMKTGQFFSPVWAIAEYRGQWYRVDGGHSSNTLAAANGHFPTNKWVMVRRFQCATYEDLLALFNEFDNRKSVRTAGDKVKVHKSAHDILDEVSPTAISDALAGIVTYYNDGTSRRVDEDERTKLIHSEKEFLSWSAPYARNKLMKRPGVLGCIYRGYIADASAAKEFADLVMNNSHPDPAHGTRILNQYLNKIWGRSLSMRDTLTVPSDTRAQYCKSIHAWNAWQRRTTTDLKYRVESPVPPMFLLVDGVFKRI